MRLSPVIAVASVLLLTGCTAPVPKPEPSTPPPLTTAWTPCDDAAIAAFSADLDGQLVLAPDDALADQEFLDEDPTTYPVWLPAPSCIAYPTGRPQTVAYFLGATQADVEAFEALILEWEGDRPTPVTGIQSPVLIAETWPMGPVIELRYVDAANGPYVQLTSVFSAVGEGG